MQETVKRTQPAKTLPPRRLLLLDDEQAILKPVAQYFESLGCVVVVTQEPEEAEAVLEHHPFDLVILDLGLTRFGREGLEVLRSVKHSHPMLPVIVMSAYVSAEVEVEARGLKADAVLKKPQRLASLAQQAFALMGARQ